LKRSQPSEVRLAAPVSRAEVDADTCTKCA
jgi:hypothetical protein